MDSNVRQVMDLKVKKTIEGLQKNHMNGYHVKNAEEIINIIDGILNQGDTISCGGSMTLFETGIIKYMRSGKYNFLDRYEPGLTHEDINKIYRDTFSADAFFTSSNAITEDGKLYNVDGRGNRVAAMLFGPKKVFVIVGTNKIVRTIDEAVERNKTMSAPSNAVRLNKNTPCTRTGYCLNCSSEERICNEYTVIANQMDKDRIHVFILDDDFGY